jgi:hypothetical protein
LNGFDQKFDSNPIRSLLIFFFLLINRQPTGADFEYWRVCPNQKTGGQREQADQYAGTADSEPQKPLFGIFLFLLHVFDHWDAWNSLT